MKNLTYVCSIFAIVALMNSSCKKDDPQPTTGTVTDVEGNEYKTIRIGSQWWMAENLKTNKLNDGTAIPFVPDATTWADPSLKDPMFCYYNNDPVNMNFDGLLYNWYAVDTKKLAPKGWHVPTDADWKQLQDYLIANGYNYDNTTSGNKIAKSLASTTGWVSSNNLGAVGNDQQSNNKSRFSALPSGYRSISANYVGQSGIACWWSANSLEADLAIFYKIASNYSYLSDANDGKKAAMSVRCVKD